MFFPSYFLISIRYLQAVHHNSTIRTMIKICFFGIFLGTFSLALIISITKGFEQATYTKMQSIYPQLIIDAHGQEIAYEQLKPILEDPSYHITNYAPEQQAHALCSSIDHNDIPYVIQVKGIEPLSEKQVTALEAMILPKSQQHFLEKLIYKNQIILGKQLAEQLQASTGSQLYITYTSDEQIHQKSTFHQTKVIVAAIFETGIEEFDAHLLYCAQDFFNQIFPDNGITQIYLKADPNNQETAVIEKLQKRIHMNVYSWKKLYTSLVAALDLEKYAMFFILLLIILVASSNIISLLFMQITQKKKDIAILLTFGLPLRALRMVFLSLSISISIVAASLGLLFAFAVGTFLQTYPWIKLPDNIYYTTHLPILMEFNLFLFIFFVVLAISFFASLIPLRKIKMKNITTILRNEM